MEYDNRKTGILTKNDKAGHAGNRINRRPRRTCCRCRALG